MAEQDCSQNVMAEFAILMEELFEEFCKDPDKGLEGARFVKNYKDIAPADAADFVFGFYRWVAGGALVDDGFGRYRTLRRGAQWYPFHVVNKKATPIRLGIRTSAILKIAVLERLYRDLRWAPEFFSHDEPWKGKWPVDLLGYDPATDKRTVGCEVRAELTTPQKDGIDDFLERIQQYGSDPDSVPVEPSREDESTLATLKFLRAYKVPFFVAAGPDGYRRLFRMSYRGASEITFIEVSEKFFRNKLVPAPATAPVPGEA